MRALDVKAFRDALNLRWQFLAIALMMGCGVGTLVMSWSMLVSLQLTQERYYDEHRFAHVFANVKRAPLHRGQLLSRIPGVVQVDLRIVEDASLDLPDMAEPASARLVSLSSSNDSSLNRLHLRSGRLPISSAEHEVVIGEGFALAHKLYPGRELRAILNGKQERLRVVGVGLSPEFIYQVRPGDFVPNDANYAVFWLLREDLESAYSMRGAFNDVAIRLAPGVSTRSVLEKVDAALASYGCRGAYGRDIQPSHRYVDNELRELRNMGFVAPAIFLAAAAALLNVVIARIVATQRSQIATLRAFGYTPWDIVWHFVQMTAVIVLVGSILGTILGVALGLSMTRMYAQFFRFPLLAFRVDPLVITSGVIANSCAAFLGIMVAVGRAASAPPAAAMQPEPPAVYRRSWIELWLRPHWLSPPTRMIIRNLHRRPVPTILSMLGLALAGAVVILGNQSADAVSAMMDFHFDVVQRQNFTVGFAEPATRTAAFDIRRLPGVMQVEPFRFAAAELSSGMHRRRQEILGLSDKPQLFRPIDHRWREHPPIGNGVVLSEKLASLLSVATGDWIDVQLLEGRRRRLRLLVEGTIEDYIGTWAYMRIDVLTQYLGEPETISGAYVLTDGSDDRSMLRHLKNAPAVASVTSKQLSINALRDTLAATMHRMRIINLGFALVIACGVAYNGARIALSERARDLASMRILGYSRAEISYVLVGEIAILALMSLPFGSILGYLLTLFASWGYDTELFRIPIVIGRSTYGLAALVTLAASVGSAMVVRRRLDHLDLVAVLKAHE